MAAADRRPVAAWAVAALGVSAVLAVPGDVLGGTAAYLSGPGPFFSFLALPTALSMLGAAALAGLAIRDLPERWFGWSRRRSRAVAPLLGVVGLTPWLVPHGPSVWRAGQAPGWAIACCGTALLALPAAALLLVPRRRTRAAAAVGLLLVAGVWGWSRQAWLDAEAHAGYLALGSPPRSLLRLVDWGGATPTVVTYQDGRVSVEYDQLTPIPSPDGNRVAALVAEPSRQRGAGFGCAEGRIVGALASDAAGFAPDSSRACLALGHGLLMVGGRTLVRQDGDVVLFLVTDENVNAYGDLPSMIRVMDSEHVAKDSEIRDLTPPPG